MHGACRASGWTMKRDVTCMFSASSTDVVWEQGEKLMIWDQFLACHFQIILVICANRRCFQIHLLPVCYTHTPAMPCSSHSSPSTLPLTPQEAIDRLWSISVRGLSQLMSFCQITAKYQPLHWDQVQTGIQFLSQCIQVLRLVAGLAIRYVQ